MIIFAGNHYGTPKPPHEPKGPLLRRSGSVGQVAPDKRKRTRSQTDSGSMKNSCPEKSPWKGLIVLPTWDHYLETGKWPTQMMDILTL